MSDEHGPTEAEALAWIRKKLELPDDAAMFSGENTIAGALHVVCSHAHGYKAYIEAYRCNDKRGEIARMAVKVAQLQQDRDRLAAVVSELRDQRGRLETIEEDYPLGLPERRLADDLLDALDKLDAEEAEVPREKKEGNR